MHNQDQWIYDLYDAAVSAAGHDGLKAADAKAVVAAEVTEAVIDGRITPEPSLIADLIVAHSMNPERSRRKASLHRELEYLIDALNGATVLGRDDPRFKQSFALGDGRDKTLGLWTWSTDLRQPCSPPAHRSPLKPTATRPHKEAASVREHRAARANPNRTKGVS